MKKKILVIFLTLFALTLASCSAMSGFTADVATKAESTNGYAYNEPMEAASPEIDWYDGGISYDSADVYTEKKSPSNYYDTGDGLVTQPSSQDFAEKMIYSATATIETTDFEASIQTVYDLVENYGGFLESSYITGQRYRYVWENYTPTRTASFTIRVPAEGFKAMKSSLGVVGNVVDVRDWAENITEQYYDTESRLETYRIEQERVLAMLEKADTVYDMLELESRLSEIRYNIESLESRLRNWQKQVDYSTLTLTIEEVERLTVVEPEKRTYWQRMGDGFMESLDDLGWFFSELFIDIVAALPVIILLAVVAAVVIIVVRVCVKRARARKQKRYLEQLAARNGEASK